MMERFWLLQMENQPICMGKLRFWYQDKPLLQVLPIQLSLLPSLDPPKQVLTVVPKYLSVTHSTENLMNGGEGGIRTRGTLRYTAFPMLHNRPLCHLSKAPKID